MEIQEHEKCEEEGEEGEEGEMDEGGEEDEEGEEAGSPQLQPQRELRIHEIGSINLQGWGGY